MPLYEYRCLVCGHRFEALVTGSQKPECPECRSPKLEKQFSTFASTGTEKKVDSGGGCGCGHGGCGHN